MGKFFFYCLIALLLAVFFTTLCKKQLRTRHIFLMISYSLYNLLFELICGEIIDLYYYIEKSDSLVYIIIADVFLYPLIAVLYVFLLPEGKKVFWFTSGAIIFLLILEIASLYTGTIVLTGWKVIPWSIVTYIVSFGLIYVFNNYLNRVLPDS